MRIAGVFNGESFDPIVIGSGPRGEKGAAQAAYFGKRAAEQAAMALDSLFIAYNRNEKMASAAEIRPAINGSFQQLENPSAYNPADFARRMRKVNSVLR